MSCAAYMYLASLHDSTSSPILRAQEGCSSCSKGTLPSLVHSTKPTSQCDPTVVVCPLVCVRIQATVVQITNISSSFVPLQDYKLS